jgi:hypothetical protein
MSGKLIPGEVSHQLDSLSVQMQDIECSIAEKYGICQFGKEVLAATAAINKLKSKVFVHEKSVMEAEARVELAEQREYAAIKAAAIEHDRDDERYEY